ncbi:phosphotransferase family protein [Mycolicibacterium canariasense]|uniref:Phosphotransferase family protein n=1 Tax=Mycolicibacterium canariasense TaxID=228230 RepID=A0A100WEA0_MYCCR|nr:phosphotransferase [Mycolicibacterium canariasense]MCV7210843.1 phosphotransferase [Mycolicibacterium canariasense]ORU99264.1 phosphotransferase [Mycolicibacterium canariasense]GAS96421.1 phosphotransferase family protein [Mycolicibacterium canariasense]
MPDEPTRSADWLSPDQLAERTQHAARAALDAGRALGLAAERATVLHDVFSVVVHLEPAPVVARIPVVVPPGYTPALQTARQQRELDVVTWLNARGVPVVPPSPLVPRRPVRRGGFAMTFWELADVTADHQPYAAVAIAKSAELHAALAGYPARLPFLAPFTEAGPGLFAALEPSELLGGKDIERVRAEFAELSAVLGDAAAFTASHPGVTLQPLQGDAPSHNVIRTTTGVRFSDFEDVCSGPVEWDLAMLGPDAVAEYDAAAMELGLRRTDPRVQQLMDAARTLQFIGCAVLVPQLPVLAQGLSSVIADWRKAPPM